MNTNLAGEELASSSQTTIDQRWQRLIQPKSYPYAKDAIGGLLCPDREIEDLHDCVRFLEITFRSPFPVFQLVRTSAPEKLFFDDNVFVYNDRQEGQAPTINIPSNFNRAYAASAGFNGLKVAFVMSEVLEEVVSDGGQGGQGGGDGAPPKNESTDKPIVMMNDVNTFSAIVIDEARGVVHRIEPDTREKRELDDAIERALAEAGCTCVYIPPSHENDGRGPSYRAVNFHETPQLTSQSFVLYKQAIFWTLQCRLAFADMSHEDLFNDYVDRWNSLADDEIEPLIMNFYTGFTMDANFHAFGDSNYIAYHSSVRFMPCFVVQMNDWLRKMSYDNLPDEDPRNFELSEETDCEPSFRDCEDYSYGD